MTYKQLWNDDYLNSFSKELTASGASNYEGENIQFWYDNKDGDLCISKHALVSKFFPALGVRNLVLGKTASGLDSAIPIFIRGNRCEEINGNILRTITFKVLRMMDDAIGDDLGEQVRTLLGFSTQLFEPTGIRTIPDLYDKEVFTDTRTSAFRFFQNGWIEITKEGVQPLRSYEELPEDKIIWNTSVIARDYVTETDVTLSLTKLRNESIHPETGEVVKQKKELNSLIKEWEAKAEAEKDTPQDEHFRDFVDNLARTDDGDVCPHNLNNLKVGIGYLCHRHHFSHMRKWVCVVDRHFDIQRQKANGGNGKSILINSLKNVMNVEPLNGKDFKKGRSDTFAFANVTPATEIAFFDDADDTFDTKRLFSRTTGDFHIRRMRQNPFSIDARKAPKIAITSNYPLGDNDYSTQRRQYLMEVSSYYKDAAETYGETPFELHGHKEIAVEDGGWNDWDWNAFYRYVWECVALYLDKGLPKQAEESDNFKRARLLLSMEGVDEREELLDYFTEKLNEFSKNGEDVFVDKFYKDTRSKFPNLPKELQNRKLYEWLKEVGIAYKLNVNKFLNGKQKHVRLQNKKDDTILKKWIADGLEEHLDTNGKKVVDDFDARVYVFKVETPKNVGTSSKPTFDLTKDKVTNQ